MEMNLKVWMVALLLQGCLWMVLSRRFKVNLPPDWQIVLKGPFGLRLGFSAGLTLSWMITVFIFVVFNVISMALAPMMYGEKFYWLFPGVLLFNGTVGVLIFSRNPKAVSLLLLLVPIWPINFLVVMLKERFFPDPLQALIF